MPIKRLAMGTLAALLTGLSGCGAPRQGSDAVVRLVPAPALTCKPEPKYRWLDCLGQPYSDEFRKSFSYARAQVEVRFPRRAPVFEGTISARRLKPNFAYQVKLVGLPPSQWGRRGHAASNRALGDAGRWWRPGPTGGNAYFLDEEKDKDGMEGYLVFGYFVTDAEGQAEMSFCADSSFHVLWKVSQWKPGEGDSAPTTHRVIAEAGRPGYDRSFPAGEVALYAEAQTGRPPVGQVRLPPGDYRCFFLLTEESFHDYYNELGGDWAAALAALIEFTILPPPPDSPGDGS
ncbi:MAG TPA: hypothetical protein PLE19_06420 [Planctomycetota bacterium]|nr:hypothetical protein [Planctomycetota bacterium]HRR81061.1 hypothetical protein [Planctomycetota bacterium]HRT97492.1 hypothetical protein [Planctomycetota bacterium]